jgi:hypothetical protein
VIRTTRQARVARRWAHVLIDWRREVSRGARIGRTAHRVDLPRRYRLNPRWVHTHLFLWDVNRTARLAAHTLDLPDFFQRRDRTDE